MTIPLTVAAFTLVCLFFSGVAIIALFEAVDDDKRQAALAHLDRLRREKEMDKPNLMRCVQTMPGDTLQDGIRRAFILSIEHGPVCLIHQCVPVVISEYSTPYEAERKWTATGKMYERREVCEGK